jgi:hypothetical protein
MRDNVSAGRADPGINPLLSAAKDSMAVNLAEVNWHRVSVSGPQFLQTFSAVLVQRIAVGDPLAEQQSSNAVRVPNALPQQRCPMRGHEPTAAACPAKRPRSSDRAP